MKILKKLLLVGLFSLSSYISVNAETTEFYGELKYSDTLVELIENNQSNINLIIDYVNSNGISSTHEPLEEYLMIFDMRTINTNVIKVRYIRVDFDRFDEFTYITNTPSTFDFHYWGYLVSYTITDNAVSSVSTSFGQYAFSFPYDTCDFNVDNCTDTINSWYFNYSSLGSQYNLVDINFTNSSSGVDVPLKVNDFIYYPGDRINLLNFAQSLSPSNIEENICNRTAVLGAVSNVNEIKLNVKGDTSVFYPLKGTFTLNYTSNVILNEDMFNVDFVNNSEIDVVGNYSFKCATDSNNCYLNYEYSSRDDIIETIDFSFKIRSADNGIMPLIKIYACVSNDDYTNISYNYSNGPSDSTTSNPNTDNYLQDGNINDASGTAGSFFENFTDNDYGLSSIITIPLTSIQKITNSTCSPISFPIPFTNKNIDLPCMTLLYEQNIPLLLNIWQIVSFGIISYAIIVDIFGLVKKFKDPNDDKLEVMDL